jgi:processive 1,2-diacylglycerol beta-glucosyltransferase
VLFPGGSAAAPSLADAAAANDNRLRIVIFYLGLGGGHKTVALTLARSIRTLAPGLVVEVQDAAEHVYPALRLHRLLPPAYQLATSLAGGRVAKLIYSIADRYPTQVSHFLDRLFGHSMRRYASTLEPTLVVSTFSILSALLAPKIHSPKNQTFKTVTVVTDAGNVNSIWFEGRPEFLLVADGKTLPHAVASGLAPGSVIVTGPVVSGLFRDVLELDQSRANLGLPNKFTITVMGGALGLGNKLYGAADELRALGNEVQFILVAGNNSKLHKKFTKFTTSSPEARVTRFTPELSKYVAASDLIVGKAGWCSLTEALAVGRPTLVVDIVGGQEHANLAYGVRHGFARYVDTAQLHQLVRGYLDSRELLRRDFAMDPKAVKAARLGADTAGAFLIRLARSDSTA